LALHPIRASLWLFGHERAALSGGRKSGKRGERAAAKGRPEEQMQEQMQKQMQKQRGAAAE